MRNSLFSNGMSVLKLRHSMSGYLAICLFALLSVFVSNAAEAAVGGASLKSIDSRTYRLGSGDVINITVFDEEDLSRLNYRLPDTGLI